MAIKTVSFTMPSAMRQEYQSDPRVLMAHQLMQQGMQPIEPNRMAGKYVVPISPLEGLSKALTAGLGGYEAGQLRNEYQNRATVQSETLAKALQAGSGTPAQSDLPGPSIDGSAGYNIPEKPGNQQEMMNILASNPDTADMGVKLLLKKMEPQGGATDYVVQKIMADNPGMSYTEALYAYQTGWRQGMMRGADGSTKAQPGYADAKGDIQYGETMGGKRAEAEMNPKIAADTEAAKTIATANANSQTADNQAIPVIDQLRKFNADSFEMPYADAVSPLLRVLPSKNIQAKLTNMDLLKQARLDLAAPLAKQLGVNPTDKDFQASLDRIFNTDASQESRAAQIDALESRIRLRQKARAGGQADTAIDPRVKIAKDNGYTDEEINAYLNGKK